MLTPIELWQVALTGGYFYDKEKQMREVTLPALLKSYEKTGRVRSFKLGWRRGEPGEPHIFWDSDIAKWIESASYILSTGRDEALEAVIDGIIDDMARGQTEDGYFNVHYQTVEKANRFTRRSDHELYCAGHLMEAAVAYDRATGKTTMLKLLCRYADHIAEVFYTRERPEDFRTPGHEEIELALVKLYEATGESRYLTLAQYFIDTRGIPAEGRDNTWFGPDYAQDHLPVREQTTAEGHAVRALYLYAGMADIARLRQDEGLRAACEKLFADILTKKMYVTGGLGGSYHGEAFSYAYDLPNELAYAETCASIAFVFFAQRMYRLTGEAPYIDAMERMLYNAIPAGLSASGDAFFYTNPLEMHPERRDFYLNHGKGQYAPEYERPVDFSCSCCPPNLIRLFASVKGYMYHTDGDNLYINLYASSELDWDGLHITQTTNYPWDGAVTVMVKPYGVTQSTEKQRTEKQRTETQYAEPQGTETQSASSVRKTLRLRVPGWCSSYRVAINGVVSTVENDKGYLIFDREWSVGDQVQFHMEMPVTEVYAHPLVHYNAGRVALMRGPVVYCAEGADNPIPIKSAVIKAAPHYRTKHAADLLGGVTVIDCEAAYPLVGDADGICNSAAAALYPTTPPVYKDTTLRLIPYAVWANRGKNEMNVWLLKA